MRKRRSSSESPPEAFDIAGFCNRYGICRDKAYEEIRTGRLRARKLGRRTIIGSADAAQWFKGLPALDLA
jgi:hypothetical protein